MEIKEWENALAQGEEECDLAMELAKAQKWELALAEFDHAQTTFTPLGHLRWLTFVKHEKLACLYALHRHEELAQTAKEAAEGYWELQDPSGLCLLLIYLAQLAQQNGQDDMALAQLQKAQFLAQHEGLAQLKAPLQGNLAVQYLLRGDSLSALQALSRLNPAELDPAGAHWFYEKRALIEDRLFLNKEAERDYLAAAEGYLKAGETALAKEVLQETHDFYRKLGEEAKARELFKRLG